MTPAARVSAAIEILDAWLAGAPAEKCLKGWARGNRYAGSKDRAAIRDLVFSAIRQRDSFFWLGGGATGRALMLGYVRASGLTAAELFDGSRYGPETLSSNEETNQDLADAPPWVQLDCPSWIFEKLAILGDDTRSRILGALKSRAPVVVRANLLKCDRRDAIAALFNEEIECAENPLSTTAITILGNARRIHQSRPYLDGLIEMQDGASQAVVDHCNAKSGERILDYCTGGGGKALALAAHSRGDVWVHDAYPKRMADLPNRAQRAGAKLNVLMADTAPKTFDLVLCDAPCSGSGSWRRDPEGKWSITQERLAQLKETQVGILNRARDYVGRSGRLVYATCSILKDENNGATDRFLNENSGWECVKEQSFLPNAQGDGFFVTTLTRVL